MAPAVATYVPRDPSHTVLYHVIAEHLETFLASLDADPDATGLPAYVEREFYQIPPDLVVKSQAIDIVEVILSRIRRPHVIHTLCRHRKARCDVLSTSEAHWFTTKSDGMWKLRWGRGGCVFSQGACCLEGYK